MNVLLIGGSGFIGSHLTPALQQCGHQVTIYDVLPTSSTATYIGRALEDLVQSDLLKMDAVVQLAAQTDVATAIRNPKYTFNSNMQGTLTFLETLRAMPEPYRPGKVLFMSTQSVYGAAEVIPTPETAPLRPVDAYGSSKAAMESLIGSWARAYDIHAITLRLSTVLGPGGKAAPNKLLNQAAKGLPITIEGTGQQTRDFTYVSDVVQAIVLALEGPRRDGIYNVSGGEEVSISAMVSMILKITGSTSPIVSREGRGRSEAGRVLLDISKAKVELGYEPKVTLEEGLRLTWEAMRK